HCRIGVTSPRGRMIRELVASFLDEIPPTRMPSGADAMRLLERVAIRGIKFPGSLIMLSKVMFTLEGLLGDIVGSDRAMGFTLVRHVAQHWLANRSAFRSPLATRDWVTLQCSALLYTSRLWVHWEQSMLNRFLTPNSAVIA
ncbi:MAG TPA: hypothetical protein VNS88_14190, partial [Nitrospiraceae bacterium]|nr:hypothetical protein [Nitrospiraceae bacterium]